MAYRLKDYLYNDKLTKEQNILMDRLYKLRMSGMAEAFEKQLLEPNTGLEPFEVRFAAIVNQEWDQRESKKFKRLMKKATLKYPVADLDSSIYDPERQLNTHVIELLAKCDWIDEPNNLLMTGGAGAGKTHIACALCITAMHQNRTVKYIRASTLFFPNARSSSIFSISPSIIQEPPNGRIFQEYNVWSLNSSCSSK